MEVARVGHLPRKKKKKSPPGSAESTSPRGPGESEELDEPTLCLGRRARRERQRGHIPEALRPRRRYAICQAVGRHVAGLVSGGLPCADGARSLRTGGGGVVCLVNPLLGPLGMSLWMAAQSPCLFALTAADLPATENTSGVS